MNDERRTAEHYDAPEVEEIPTESGPSVTAADGSGPSDAGAE